jgi:hypothetical protein
MSAPLPLGGMDRCDRRWAITLSVTFFLCGVAFVVLVPPGLPYDEPSHFSTVQFYSHLNGMPVIGEPGVTYEAYHPPLYYYLAGLLYRVLVSGGTSFAFYGIRIATLAASTPLPWITYVAARRFSRRRRVAQLAGVLMAFNPSILAIASSVQNDSLTFLLASTAAYLCVSWTLSMQLSFRRMLIISLLTAAGIMTKTSALPVVPFVAGIIVLANPRRAPGFLLLLISVVLICDGWWFIRNERLYHDWTGARAVATLFAGGTRFNILKWHSWEWGIRNIITYHTIPIEYWRNQFKAPKWMSFGIGLASAFAAFGATTSIVRRRLPTGPPGRAGAAAMYYAAFAASGIIFWLMVSATDYLVPARAGMASCAATLFVIAAAMIMPTSIIARWGTYWRAAARHLPQLFVCILVIAQIALLAKAARLPREPYQIALTARVTTSQR